MSCSSFPPATPSCAADLNPAAVLDTLYAAALARPARPEGHQLLTWHRLVRQVRAVGHYGTDQEAERVSYTVLTRACSPARNGRDPAAVLPENTSLVFASQIPLTEPVAAPAFVEAVARALNTSLTSVLCLTSSVPVTSPATR